MRVFVLQSIMITFTKWEILENIPINGDLSEAMNYLLRKLNIRQKDSCQTGLKHLKAALSTLRTKRNKKWNEVCRIKERFEKKNLSWLDSEFTVPNIKIANESEESSFSSGPGRPLKFEKKSDRSKRREAANISANLDHDPQRILQACCHAAKHSHSGNKDLHAVISRILESPERPKKIRKLDTMTPIIEKNPEEALAFPLDNSMSKNVYTNMRLEVKECGADIWQAC